MAPPVGQAPGWSTAVYVAFLHQRHETKAEDRLTPTDTTMATLRPEVSAARFRVEVLKPIPVLQFGVSTGSDYGHIPTCMQGERCPHPVDFVVDET